MVQTLSTMLPLGTAAPDFTLPDADGNLHSLSESDGAPATLVMFICNHCPFVHHVAPQLAAIGRDYKDRGLAIYAINSNDVGAFPDDSPAMMKQFAVERGFSFPYLFDESQEVAKAYTAACTPDFFLFDAQRKLVYRGQLDATRPHRISSGHYDSSQNPPTGADLRAAIDATLDAKDIPAEQRPSVGCNIKWKPGNEPDYFAGG